MQMATRKRIDYKVFATNVALAFAAGFITSFGAFMAATPEDPGFAALVSAGSAALYAGFRATVGYLVSRSGTALNVDK